MDALLDNMKANYMYHSFARAIMFYFNVLITVYLLINVLILITMRDLVDPILASFTVSFTSSVCSQLTIAMKTVIDSNAVGASIERVLVY
jgi:hypothetical protein